MAKFSETSAAGDCLRTLQKIMKALSEGYTEVITLREIVKISRKACESKKGFFLPADKLAANPDAEFWILTEECIVQAIRQYFLNNRRPMVIGTTDDIATIGLQLKPSNFKPSLIIPVHSGEAFLGLFYLEEPNHRHEAFYRLYEVIAQITSWYVLQREEKGQSASYFVDLDQYPKALDRTTQLSDLAARRSFIQKRYANVISISPLMLKILREIDKLSEADSAVLIEGESGTGKELVATTVHFNSLRKDKPFLPVNCSAIPFELFESEFFGHVKGSFTGAVSDQEGLFQRADGGTLFLDEIGELPLTMQSKLLRALEEKEIRPVGSEKVVHVDVRLISATNRNLKDMIARNQFRQDLYYRINTFNLKIPPLRHRKEDIPPLVSYFLQQISTKTGIPTKQVSREGMRKLVEYDWPGNIRELYNALERAALMAPDVIAPAHISIQAAGFNESPMSLSKVPANLPINEVFENIEKAMIEDAIKIFSGNKQRIAKRLGIDRKTLYRKMKQYNLIEKSS